MAQHLSPDILFHIFTSFSSPDQYLNGLMLVCHDWYEITNYEMFWLATLKSIMKQQIHACKNSEHLVLDKSIDSTKHFAVIKLAEVLKERKTYLSSMEKREKILIIDLKPFTKRRETNDDIYGDSYKQKCVQFIRERRRRMVSLELAKLASEFENDVMDIQLFENKWNQILKIVENNSYYPKNVVANLGILNSSTTIFHIFLKQYQFHFANFIGGGNEEFLDRVVSFFIYDCGLSVSSSVEQLIKAKAFNSFLKERGNNDEKETIFEKFRNEINFTGKAGVAAHLLCTMFENASLENTVHVQLIRKCIELFKSKKLLKFKENMVEPYVSNILTAFRPSWEVFELYLKDLNILECKNADDYQFLSCVFHKLYSIGEEEAVSIVEHLKRAHKELGLKLNTPIPRSLTTRSGKIDFLKLMVENGADVNCPPPCIPSTPNQQEYQYGVPLASIIYHCYSGRRTDEILYLIENGAILPPIDTVMPTHFYDAFSYANILDYYYDKEDVYLPTLKILVEKFGRRFSGAEAMIENFRYTNNTDLTYDGFCEVLLYFKQVTSFNPDFCSAPLTAIYCAWDSYCREDQVGKKEQLREFLENELGIQLVQSIIDSHAETIQNADNDN